MPPSRRRRLSSYEWHRVQQCAVLGPPVSFIASALAIRRDESVRLLRRTHTWPTHLSTASTAFTAASNSRCAPPSQLAKFTAK